MPKAGDIITIHTAYNLFPNADGTTRNLVNEFQKNLTLLGDLPLVEGSGVMEDDTPFQEPYELDKASQVVDLDHGAQPHTYGSYSRKQPMEMREASLQYFKKHKMFVPGSFSQTVNLHVQRTISDTSLDMEHDLFYATPQDNTLKQKYMIGLTSRFAEITDLDGVVQSSSSPNTGLTLSTITLDAGGTANGKLGSAYFIVPGEDAACLVYPKGSEFVGFQYEPGEWQRTKDEDGGAIDARTDIFRFTCGLSLRQRHAAIRIANIDFLSTEGLSRFEDCLYDVGDIMPEPLKNRMILYIPQRASSKVKKYFYGKVNTITTGDGGFTGAFRETYIDGVGILRNTFQLTLKEDKIA